MKTAGKVLGIAGGAIGLIGSYFVFQRVAVLRGIEIFDINISLPADNSAQAATQTVILVIGALCIIGSVLGFIGGLIVKKHRFASGAMMITGGVLNIFSDFDLIVFTLLTVGGILALIQANDPAGPYKRQQALKITASALGIAGGSLSLLYAANHYTKMVIDKLLYSGSPFDFPPDVYEYNIPLLIAICGIIGIVGGALVSRRRALSGLLMLAGSLAGFFDKVPFILLLLGGIFALIPEKKPEPQKEETV